MERNWKDLGRAVAFARKAAGWTQAYLSAVTETRGAHVSSRTIGSLERGEPVSDGTLQSVAAALLWSPSTPQEILDGRIQVGLAGEILPAGGAAGFRGSGSGTLMAMVTPTGQTLPVQAEQAISAADQVLQALTLIDAASIGALRELRELLLAVREQIVGLTDDNPRSLELIDEAIERVDVLEVAEAGRRLSSLAELTEARNRLVHGAAARRGRKTQVEFPDHEHAE